MPRSRLGPGTPGQTRPEPGYIEATYYIETHIDVQQAAQAIADEQSTGIGQLGARGRTRGLQPWTARVVLLEDLGSASDNTVVPYALDKPLYASAKSPGRARAAQIRIAYPIANISTSIVDLWNTVGGEVHRQGYLTTARLIDVHFPNGYLDGFAGPRYGLAGIRKRFGVGTRPIFCRSSHPAVGHTPEATARLSAEVLRGGFDVVKDDELMTSNSRSPFQRRVRRVVDLAARITDETGEKKSYVANVIADLSETFRRAEFAADAGVDALLVSPAIQGITIASEVASRTDLPVMCHPTWLDALTRHPKFGVSPSVVLTLQRLCGADIVPMPGDFATAQSDREADRHCLGAAIGPLGMIKPSLPFISGGKKAGDLALYLRTIGSPDFMIIAMFAVDGHPLGIAAGAREFRAAWEAIVRNDGAGGRI